MGHTFGSTVLIIGFLFCVLTTWSSATAPESFANRLGLKTANAGGINEIRAQYAGFFFAVGIICALSLAGILSRQASFVVLGTLFGGLVAGRFVSLAINGGFAGYGRTIIALFAIDAFGFASAVAALILDR